MDVFLNDLHAGSHHAPYPMDALPKRDSAVSRYLTERLGHTLQSLPKKFDRLHLVGDLIDGCNRKSQCLGVWTADMGEQAEMAAELLKPFADRARVVMRYRGTPYHEGNAKCLEGLTRELGIEEENNNLWVQDIKLRNGMILNVAHHPMGGSTLYSGTGLDREQVWSSVAAGAGHVEKPSIIVRGHRHHWGKLETELALSVALPCWKLPSPHEIKANYWRYHSSIGLVTMEYDDAELYSHRFKFLKVDIAKPKARSV